MKAGKGKWERSVPLTPQARKIIADLGERLFHGLDANYSTERFRFYLRQTGLNSFKLHSLRHAFGTRLHRAGVDIYTIARLLGGHRDIRTSLIYAKVTPDTMQSAIKKLEDLLAVAEMQQSSEQDMAGAEK